MELDIRGNQAPSPQTTHPQNRERAPTFPVASPDVIADVTKRNLTRIIYSARFTHLDLKRPGYSRTLPCYASLRV